MLAIRKTANQIALGAATGTGLFMGTKTLVDEQFHKPEIEKINSEADYYQEKTSEISPQITIKQLTRSQKQNKWNQAKKESGQAKQKLEEIQARKAKIEKPKTIAQKMQDNMHEAYINKGKTLVQLAKQASLFNCLLQKLQKDPNNSPQNCQSWIPSDIQEIKREE